MTHRLKGTRFIGPGGVDAGPVTPLDPKLRVQYHVLYENLGSFWEVSKVEFHKVLWAVRFDCRGRITHVGPFVYVDRLQKRGLAPKFPVAMSRALASPIPAKTKRSASGNPGSQAKRARTSAIDCSHGDPGDPPCAACESRHFGFRPVSEVRRWSEAGRICIQDLDRGVLNIIGFFRLEALGLPTAGPGVSLRASAFQLLSPTQLALSGIDSATIAHISVAFWTSRNSTNFNHLQQALLCLGRVLSAETWRTLITTGVAEVAPRVLRNFPKGVSLAPPQGASRFSLVGIDTDPELGPCPHVTIVLPDVLATIRALSKTVGRVFVSIVENGHQAVISGRPRIAFPSTYVPKPDAPDDTDTVIVGAETLSWSTLAQVLTTAPPDGRIVFEGCYVVPEALRSGQVPFLYLLAFLVRLDCKCAEPGKRHAIYAGQPLRPPGIEPKRAASLFKRIRKLRPYFERGLLQEIDGHLAALKAAMPLLKRAVVSAFPAAPPSQSEPEVSEPPPG